MSEPIQYNRAALSARGARISAYMSAPEAPPNSKYESAKVHGMPRMSAMKLSPKRPWVMTRYAAAARYRPANAIPSFDLMVISVANTATVRMETARRWDYYAKCLVLSHPPSHVQGTAVTAIAIGYQCGDKFHPATTPSTPPTKPIPASIHTCFIGFAGASLAVTYPPKMVYAIRYKSATASIQATKSPSEETGGKTPMDSSRKSVATDKTTTVINPASTAPTLFKICIDIV
ncbi:MAG: hypothetical protein JWL87_234 [Candidatus Adlerbacteria bacterium]|nr:hypothetical protein [Candidatus Adlerbacteria bacterium]